MQDGWHGKDGKVLHSCGSMLSVQGNAAEENSINNPPVDWPNMNGNQEVPFQTEATEANPFSTRGMAPTPTVAQGFTQQNPPSWNQFPSL
jgi:hypothetical protein